MKEGISLQILQTLKTLKKILNLLLFQLFEIYFTYNKNHSFEGNIVDNFTPTNLKILL